MIARPLRNTLAAGLLAGLAPAVFATPQERTAVHPARQQAGEDPTAIPVVALAELEFQQFIPRNVTARDLWQVAAGMVGRTFLVRERGLGSRPVSNLSLLGESLIVYDTADYGRKVLEALQSLDVARRTAGSDGSEVLTTMEFRPRYVSLGTLQEALRPFSRNVQQRDERGESWYVPNVSIVQDRSLVIVRETARAIGEIRALLERIDVPQEQVRLTCTLIRGAKEASGEGLPEELTANLARLVPQYRFESIGFAMIQTAAASGRSVQLRIEGSGMEDFELELRPTAFDPETASLTIDRCQLVRREYQMVSSGEGEQRQRAGSTELFTTSTILRGGEYTVLGATGKDPVFLVLRLTPVSRGRGR